MPHTPFFAPVRRLTSRVCNCRWTGLDAFVQLQYGDLPLHTTRTKPKFVGFATPLPAAASAKEGSKEGPNEVLKESPGVQLLRAEFNTEVKE